jgi:hypothetical protein
MKYVWKDGAWRGDDGQPMDVPNRIAVPMIQSDYPPYFSIASGKWVDGKSDRREDLKRTGCIPAEPKPKKDMYCTSKKWAERLGLEHNNAPGAARPRHWK